MILAEELELEGPDGWIASLTASDASLQQSPTEQVQILQMFELDL